MSIYNVLKGFRPLVILFAPGLVLYQPFTAAHASQIADWVKTARIGSADVYSEMTNEELETTLTQRRQENVSVLELDTKLSYYLNDSQFDQEAQFIDKAARRAHEMNMRSVIYFPALEVITENGANLPNTMYKDHPDWVQYGLQGAPNVFYGSLEHWVEPNAESAWMCPNSPYREYYLNRIRKLAAMAVDGVWVDVPVYSNTGTAWPGAGQYAEEAFRQWSIANGLGGSRGFSLPTQDNFADPVFRAWVRWRHENLADFLEDVRKAAHEVNPDFLVIVEAFPLDNVDATAAGLDGNFRRSTNNFIRVWEVDSVSNTRGMQWSNLEDFDNKIAMLKWARGADRENPSWSFSYGYQPLDASLVMAAVVATGNVPFEAQTPEMTLSVDANFRRNWFGFIADNSEELLNTPRFARVGVWYSSASRDYQDRPIGGDYGMYVTTESPNNDPDWWATDEADSAIPKPHLGGWRGAAHALIQLNYPFKVVSEPGDPKKELEGLSFLWLPSVAAITDESAELIKNFVAEGGIVLSTGSMPGQMDELGNARTTNPLASLFGLANNSSAGPTVNQYGKGLAILRPDLQASELFGEAGDADRAADILSTVEQLLRIHVPEDVVVNGTKGIHVEVAKPSQQQHYLYVVNYSGLKQPLVSAPKTISLNYTVPEGYEVTTAQAETPDANGQIGSLRVAKVAENTFSLRVKVDQFAMITVNLQPVQARPSPALSSAPLFSSERKQQAAESGLNFILSKMRNTNAPEPYNFGVFTNLVDTDSNNGIYSHGHNVTSEHMGLLLQASACMKNETAYNQAARYIKEAMYSPLYHVVNWSVDKQAFRPLIEMSDDGTWLNANSPLDDFRVVRGLLDSNWDATGEASSLAKSIYKGLYWTSITDKDRDAIVDFPAYKGGLAGFAWDWAETNDLTLTPPAIATGLGRLTMDLIPVDYQDLPAIATAARFDARWKQVFSSTFKLLLNSEIKNSNGRRTGLFYNGLQETGGFTGDFENQDSPQGNHLKAIQELWTALHLAQISTMNEPVVTVQQRRHAKAAAKRSLSFFKRFYSRHQRVPEYLTFSGQDVPDCGSQSSAQCLERGNTNLFEGEARIYALLARLALVLGDRTFADRVIEEKILTDWIDDPANPRYGAIGVSTTGDNDAEAWNVLESVLTLCTEATVAR